MLAVSFRLRGLATVKDRTPSISSRQPYFQKMPRLLIHETAIHLIDVFRTIAGEVTDKVFARLEALSIPSSSARTRAT